MRSIRRYLLGWVLGALGLGAIVITLAAYLVTLHEMNEVYDADLQHVAESLGGYLHATTADVSLDVKRMPQRLDKAHPEEIVTVLWTLRGEKIFSTDPRVDIPFLSEEKLTRAKVGDEDWFVYTDVSPRGIVQAAQRVHARHETATEAASQILPVMIGICLSVFALLFYSLKRGLRPMDEAASDIAARSARSLAPLVEEDFPAELTPMVRALNGLMERLSLALSTQRDFLGDAAHELRSPIAALRLQLQLLKRAGTEADRNQAVDALEKGIARSQGLVEKLLQMARSDPDAEARHVLPVDLGAMVREIVGLMSARADALELDLGARTGADVIMLADRHDLEIMITNLVENALRYTPAGGVIDVHAESKDDRAILRVVDSGPGIPDDERRQVFDRFFRGSDAQVLSREAGGSGLGLAIVQRLAHRYDAEVELRTAPSGRGLEVRVSFARSPSTDGVTA